MLLKSNGLGQSEKAADNLQTLFDQVTSTNKPGFVRILTDEKNWSESKKWGETLKSKYKQLVLIGIGGSSMGARALANYRYSDEILFLSDIKAELDAAKQAGLHTCWLVRDAIPDPHAQHQQVTQFGDIRFS